MNYQAKLEAMSDGELNVIFAKTVDTHKNHEIRRCKDIYAIEFITKDGDVFRYNYCNNPNDIMPLAFEKGLSLKNRSGIYHVDNDNVIEDYFFKSNHTNPLRAAVIVLLLIDKEKEK